MPDQETEITLGIGKLLGMFLGLVVLSGVFFVAGYSIGKNSVPARASLTEPIAPTTTSNAATKPPAVQVAQAKMDPPASGNASPVAASEPSDGMPARNPDPAPVAAKIPAQPPRGEPAAAGNYIVQVAAISKQQDAEALVAALRRKQYAVFIAPQSGDSLFHVQIGPFSDNKEAEAMRGRLIADGYNPIVKR